MPNPGTQNDPLRVAIFGSGPAAFYAADALLKQSVIIVQIDMFERLPAPFGLVRYGVAPDHPKIKSVTKVYDGIAANKNFRFYGNVEFGKHLKLDDLKLYYHQIVFATGAQTDRKMGIPGEELEGSHTATEFVAWYNGHPDYRHLQFDLTQESAAIIGVGNVAIDVARILSRTPSELAKTDIADYALDALRQSKIKTVNLIGRRGPLQAAFTNPEIKEVGEMEQAVAITLPDEMELDDLSKADMESSHEPGLAKKLDILKGYSLHNPDAKPRKLFIRFLHSPVELTGVNGHVAKMRLVRNILTKTESGSLAAKATDKFEDLQVGLVFRAVGYRGLPLPEIPFNDRWGVILNVKGRVLDQKSNQPVVGLYTTGWIKRGPTGVIGTNKPDSVETVGMMLEDLAKGSVLNPLHPDVASAERFICDKQPKYISYADWLKLDKMEIERGSKLGRPRIKFTSTEDMLAALGK
jgi:ferredoxin/flavodoxin---NADP+ reductase